MNGTVSTFRNRVGVLQESRVRVCSALGTREMGYVLGDARGIVDECLMLHERFGGEFFVLVHGPVSAMAGVDLQGACLALEEATGLPAIGVSCSGNEPYGKGISKALLAVFERVEGEQEDAPGGGVNVLGLTSVDFNDPVLRAYICGLIEQACGERVRSVWGSRDGWEQWRHAVGARENVVVSTSALPLAKKMRRVWGTPYRCIDELGIRIEGDGAAARHAGRVLVVHEQLFANVVRRQLEGIGIEADVASFFTMNRMYMREGDLRLYSEGQLVELLESGAYGTVLIDPDAAACVPAGVQLFPLEHSAIAQLAPVEHQRPLPLTREWLAAL